MTQNPASFCISGPIHAYTISFWPKKNKKVRQILVHFQTNQGASSETSSEINHRLTPDALL